MTRSNRSPSAGSSIVNTLRPYEGGTGQTTAAAALTAMDVVPMATVNQPNGVAGLDSTGKLPSGILPVDKMSVVSVEGATSLVKSALATYKINNFDMLATYTLVANAGATVSRYNDTINFTAPNVSGVSGFTINGRQVSITVVDVKPNAPTLAAVDLSGGTNAAALQCSGSAFSMNSGNATQASSDWQVASDNAFNTIVSQSNADTVNLLTWKSGALSLSTTYYARLRYRDSDGGVSDWSNTVIVTTKSSYVIQTEEAKLLATDAANNDNFGNSVSISSDGSRAIVGSHGKTSNTGAAYVFLRTGTTWTQEQKITASDATTYSAFGFSVSMSSDGSRVAIGSSTKMLTYGGQGAVYVFLRTGTTWTQEQRLLASDPTTNAGFGTSVSITPDGTRLVVGAYSANIGTFSGCGSAYIFSRSGVTWSQESEILASDPNNTDYFGRSVSISSDGSRVVIGAYDKTGSAGVYQGAAYIFLRTSTTWAQEAKLLAGDAAANDQFGFSSVIFSDGSSVAIGAFNKSGTVGTGQGAVYIFARTNTSWAQINKIMASDTATGDNFGYSVAVSSDMSRMEIGAKSKNSGTGAVYSER